MTKDAENSSTLIASPTIWGDGNNPWKKDRIISPGVEPQSTLSPGPDKRAAAGFTHISFPATYPPHGAMVPLDFYSNFQQLNLHPAHDYGNFMIIFKSTERKGYKNMSYTTSGGSILSTNSP